MCEEFFLAEGTPTVARRVMRAGLLSNVLSVHVFFLIEEEV